MSVLVGTSVGPGKGYCLQFLIDALRRLDRADSFVLVIDGDVGEGGEDLDRVCADVDGLGGIVLRHTEPVWAWGGLQMARIARVRETIRRYFVDRPQFSHLYFHDADMLAPASAIPTLMECQAALASGIYNQRDWRLPMMPGAAQSYADGRIEAATSLRDFERRSDGRLLAGHFGMGCMLLRRDVLEAVAWRAPQWLFEQYRGEDIQYCADAFQAGFGHVALDPSVSCWHIGSDGIGNRLKWDANPCSANDPDTAPSDLCVETAPLGVIFRHESEPERP